MLPIGLRKITGGGEGPGETFLGNVRVLAPLLARTKEKGGLPIGGDGLIPKTAADGSSVGAESKPPQNRAATALKALMANHS